MSERPDTDAPRHRVYGALTAAAVSLYLLEQSAAPTPAVPGVLMALCLASVLAVLLARRRARVRTAAWGAVTASLGAVACYRYGEVANHHFVLTYLALGALLMERAAASERDAIAFAQARWMLVAIMGLAVLQKLLSPSFMDGSFVTFMLAKGEFLKPASMVPAMGDVFDANDAAHAALRASDPLRGGAVALTAPPGIGWVTWILVAAILVGEAAIALLVAFVPRHPLSRLSLLGMVLVTATIRSELEFLGVVSLLGFGLSCHDAVGSRWPRRFAALALVVFALAFVFRLA